MVYIGSKNRLARRILPIILKDRKPGQWYVEPFVGGANTIDKVTSKRLGNDSHYYLIELLRAIQRGWQPPMEVSKEEYYEIKKNMSEYSPELVGFVGFVCSFGGKWWGSYARSRPEDKRNYIEEGFRNLIKQAKNLEGIKFVNKDYRELEIPPSSIIYSDPPYRNVYNYSSNFDHECFYKWCVGKKKEGHTVYVSEYSMPEDNFECVLKLNRFITLANSVNNELRIEKLFICRS